jgi:hypothetical protein
MVTRIVQRFSNFKVLFLSLIISVFLLGCGKSMSVKWVYYDETQCADKWDFSPINEKLKENVTNYLNSKDIKVLEIEIFNDRTPDACTSCNCKTGRRVKVKVKKRDLSEIKSEQFYEP